jgi:hypothetical protein
VTGVPSDRERAQLLGDARLGVAEVAIAKSQRWGDALRKEREALREHVDGMRRTADVALREMLTSESLPDVEECLRDFADCVAMGGAGADGGDAKAEAVAQLWQQLHQHRSGWGVGTPRAHTRATSLCRVCQLTLLHTCLIHRLVDQLRQRMQALAGAAGAAPSDDVHALAAILAEAAAYGDELAPELLSAHATRPLCRPLPPARGHA